MGKYDNISKVAEDTRTIEQALYKINDHLGKMDQLIEPVANKYKNINGDALFGAYQSEVEEIKKKTVQLIARYDKEPNLLANSIEKVDKCENKLIGILDRLENLDRNSTGINNLYEAIVNNNDIEKLNGYLKQLDNLKHKLSAVVEESNGLLRYEKNINEISTAIEAAQSQYSQSIEKMQRHAGCIENGNSVISSHFEMLDGFIKKQNNHLAAEEGFRESIQSALVAMESFKGEVQLDASRNLDATKALREKVQTHIDAEAAFHEKWEKDALAMEAFREDARSRFAPEKEFMTSISSITKELKDHLEKHITKEETFHEELRAAVEAMEAFKNEVRSRYKHEDEVISKNAGMMEEFKEKVQTHISAEKTFANAIEERWEAHIADVEGVRERVKAVGAEDCFKTIHARFSADDAFKDEVRALFGLGKGRQDELFGKMAEANYVSRIMLFFFIINTLLLLVVCYMVLK